MPSKMLGWWGGQNAASVVVYRMIDYLGLQRLRVYVLLRGGHPLYFSESFLSLESYYRYYLPPVFMCQPAKAYQ